MDQIKQRYVNRLTEIIEELSGSKITISFEVIKKDNNTRVVKKTTSENKTEKEIL